MRNMSFALTTDQVRDQSKDVTRRLGWANLKAGDLVQPVVKGMGLRKGEKVQKIGPPIRVVSNTPEPLTALLGNHDYGWDEIAREGFFMHPDFGWPLAWVEWFAKSHGCTTAQVVNRIEFEYTEGATLNIVLKAEGASPDATDRENCANASPGGGPMGVGQAAAAAPAGGLTT